MQLLTQTREQIFVDTNAGKGNLSLFNSWTGDEMKEISYDQKVTFVYL